eukprot:gene9887-10935_t
MLQRVATVQWRTTPGTLQSNYRIEETIYHRLDRLSIPSLKAIAVVFTSIVGGPTMTPYHRWSLGFHNCKYGHTSLQQVEEVVANTPLVTQWMDIDYMQNCRDFTLDY